MITTPDFDRAATAAMQLLADRNNPETPIRSMDILLNYPRVRVIPYTQAAEQAGVARHDLVFLFGNREAASFRLNMPDNPELSDVDYLVFYNMLLSDEVVRRGIARELGHIVLGHDGMTRPHDVRLAEAICFAHHLLTPRPIIHVLQQSGHAVTLDMLVETTGCSDSCVDEIQRIPGTRVPVELNKKVKDLYASRILEYVNYHFSSDKADHSHVLDFGTYMDGYEE